MKKIIAIFASLWLILTSCGNNGNPQSGIQSNSSNISQKWNGNVQNSYTSRVNTTSRAS